MDSLRGIITTEIEDYLHNIIDQHEVNKLLLLIQSVDYSALSCLKSIVNNVSSNNAESIINILNKYGASDNDKLATAEYIRKAATVTGLCGWFMEHIARNKLDLDKAPNLYNYVDVCTTADGKIDRLKSLINNKVKKPVIKHQKMETYMDIINNIETDNEE